SNTVTGGSGTDTVIWNLGNGDLSFTSGGGQNELDVTGTTGADTMSVTPSGGGIAVTTSGGNVSATGMQKANLIGLGGPGTFTVGDLSGTGVTGVGIQGNPGAPDTITVDATATSNNLWVTAPTGYALSVNLDADNPGLPYQVNVFQMSATDGDRLIVAA